MELYEKLLMQKDRELHDLERAASDLRYELSSIYSKNKNKIIKSSPKPGELYSIECKTSDGYVYHRLVEVCDYRFSRDLINVTFPTDRSSKPLLIDGVGYDYYPNHSYGISRGSWAIPVRHIEDEGMFAGRYLDIELGGVKLSKSPDESQVYFYDKSKFTNHVGSWLNYKPRIKSTKDGGVYVLRAVGTGLFKIGMSNGDVMQRVASIQTNTPNEIHVEHTKSDPNPLQLEKSLHNMFSDKRVRGEWFRLSKTDLMKIKTL
jgi:hypothetical protein